MIIRKDQAGVFKDGKKAIKIRIAGDEPIIETLEKEKSMIIRKDQAGVFKDGKKAIKIRIAGDEPISKTLKKEL